MDLGSIINSTTSAIGGSLAGSAFRLIPEGMKFLDRRSDRAHEVDMFKLQLAADAQKTAEQLSVINAQHAADADTKDLDALIAGVTVQGAHSGVSWVDGLNALVRPLLTIHWCVLLYSAVLWARYDVLVHSGTAGADAILQLWGPPEYGLVASMLSFWFVDRSLRKGGGVGPGH